MSIALHDLEQIAATFGFCVVGGFNPEPDSADIPSETETLVLLGPKEPGFWSLVIIEPEFSDGLPDPLDRSSRRRIGALAQKVDGTALFPFDGPPYLPFITWATNTGQCWSSPVGLLVHETAGLLLSVRGALALPYSIDFPEPAKTPCDDCPDRPCTTACPISALTDTAYDAAACHGFLDTRAGKLCLSVGCRVRLACPISQRYGRVPEQSGFHMRAFHGTQ